MPTRKRGLVVIGVGLFGNISFFGCFRRIGMFGLFGRFGHLSDFKGFFIVAYSRHEQCSKLFFWQECNTMNGVLVS